MQSLPLISSQPTVEYTPVDYVITDSLARGLIRNFDRMLIDRASQASKIFCTRPRWVAKSLGEVPRVAQNYVRLFKESGLPVVCDVLQERMQSLQVFVPVIDHSPVYGGVTFRTHGMFLLPAKVHIAPTEISRVTFTWHAISRIFQRMKTTSCEAVLAELALAHLTACSFRLLTSNVAKFRHLVLPTEKGVHLCDIINGVFVIKTFIGNSQLRGARKQQCDKLREIFISARRMECQTQKAISLIGERLLAEFPSWASDRVIGEDEYELAKRQLVSEVG